MKIVSACIYILNIPFVESFGHNLYERNHCDSIIVKLTGDCGASGFGEGVPRPYVTGETKEESVEYIRSKLLPGIIGEDLSGADTCSALTFVDRLLPAQDASDPVAWNASRSAVELAAIDCLLRSRKASLNVILPSESQEVTYSGVITSGSIETVEKIARRCVAAGIETIKLKVCKAGDVEVVSTVRDIVGNTASIRLDANSAFNPDTVLPFLSSVSKYDIECIEQPIPRGNPTDLAKIRSASPIRVMADESVVSIRDAVELIEKKAVDYFNLRISKCGGLHNTLEIAELAGSAGIGIQLGCQVGETAILSAAGRHAAAHLEDLRFVEGSFGTHLLVEDIAQEDLVFGLGGYAPVLTDPGLGITVQEEILDKYAQTTIPVC